MSIRTYEGGVAIVTGGASGIGRAICEELTRRGCEAVIADRQAEVAEEFASELRQSGKKATAVEVDVTDYPAVERLVQDTMRRTGRLDYMFNNAGIAVIGGYVDHFSIEDWHYIVEVNVKGAINGVQAVYKTMAKQGFGHIVNTASMSGLIPRPGGVAYAATKYAVVGLSISLRAEAARFGVRVSVLCPGTVRTSMLATGGKFGRMLGVISQEDIMKSWESMKPIPPASFAEKVLNAIAKNQALIIVPSWYKWFWRLNRFFPSIAYAVTERKFKADLEMQGLGPDSR